MQSAGTIIIVECTQAADRRQAEKSVTKALHPPAFLVDGDKHARFTPGVDVVNKCSDLLRAVVVAGKQNDAADRRVLEKILYMPALEAADLVKAENKDRQAVYKAIAAKTGGTVAQVGQLVQDGQFEAAKKLQLQMIPVNQAVTAIYGVPGLKSAMDMLGYFGGDPRLPLLPATEQEQSEIKEILQKAELLK